MKIYLGSDHAGFKMKKSIIEYLNKNSKLELIDRGCFDESSVDYPDFSHLVAKDVSIDSSCIGILICGSGQGVCMTANKYSNIRASICWSVEIAKLTRQHNDSNIICLPARFISDEESFEIIDIFMNTEFEGGRHQNRINKISIFS